MLKRLLFAAIWCIALVGSNSIFAQVGSYSFATTSSTFTPISGGTDVNSIEADDALSSAIPLGFTFYMEGNAYTDIKVSSNGWASFGTPTSSTTSNNLDGAAANLRPVIAPLWDDLAGASTSNSQASYAVTGTSPNRVFTFEWLNWEWRYNATDSVVSFQMKLYETTNEIQFTYRWENYGGLNSPSASIGLTGASTWLSVGDIDLGTPIVSNTLEYSSIDTVVTDQVFTFTPPACSAPGAAYSTNKSLSSVDIAWGSSGTGPWYIWWGPCGFDQATSGVQLDTASSLSFQATGLQSNTGYEFRIFEDCGTNGLSDTVVSSCIYTLCGAVSVPFYEGFNSNSSTQNCWTVLDSNLDGDMWNLDYTTNELDGDEVAMMYTDYNAGNNDDWLISPAITLAANERLRFFYRVQSSGEPNDFELLVSSSGTNPSDFTDTLMPLTAFSNTVYQEMMLDLSAYSGNKYIAWHIPQGGLDGWRLYIDSVVVETIPPCPMSTNLIVNTVGPDSAQISWIPGGSAVNYGIEYGPKGFTPGTGSTMSVVDTFAVIKPLSVLTQYDFYVYDSCSTGNSIALGPVTASTTCLVQSLPYNETFDTDLGCFVVSQNGGSTNDTWQWVADYSSFSGAQTLDNDTGFAFVDSDGAGSGVDMDEILVSPVIDASTMPTGGALILEFDQYYRALGDTAAVDVWDGTQWVNLLKQYSTIGGFGSPDHQFIDVTAYANANFQVRFHYYNANYAWYWAVDNFSVEALPCGIASALDTGLVTPNSAELKWASNGSMWNIVWGPPGFNQASGNGNYIYGVTSNPYTLSGLGADSCYSYYVQDTCSGSGSGPWIGPFIFCTPPTCPAPTMAGVIGSSITTNSADVYWTTGGAVNFNIEYGPAGFAIGSGIRTQATNDTLTLSSLNPSTAYEFYVRDSCSATDTSTWSGPVAFTTLCTAYPAPYYQDFDGSDWVADDVDFSAANSQVGLCWERSPEGSSSYNWRVRSTATGSSSTGPNADSTGANFVYTEASSGSSGDSTMLISPSIDMVNLSTPELTYAYHFYGSSISKMYVAIENNGIWTTVDSIIGAQQSSSSDPWLRDTVDLASYYGQTIRVAFVAISGGCCSGDLAIDAFRVGDPVSCISADMVAVNNASCDSVEVSWTSDVTSTGSYIEYGSRGFVPGTGTVIANVSSPWTINGLMLDTEYDVYVIDSCANGAANPSSVVTFETDSVGPVLASFTYTQVSTTLTDADVDVDASASAGDGLTYDWDFDNGSTGTGVTAQANYTANASYNVTLTVTDRCGNTDDTTVVVTVAGISIVENAYNAGIEMYPNPNNGTFKVNVSAGNGKYAIQVMELSGKVIYTKADLSPGHAELVELNNVADGVYMVRLVGDGLNVTQRILVD